MDGVFGILFASIPAAVISGLLLAVLAIFEMTDLVKQVALNYNGNLGQGVKMITDYDLFTGLVYIIANLGMSFIGVIFCWNAVRYLKGNELIGILIGLSLASPWLMGGLNWKLFSIWSFDISIKSYGTSMLVQVIAGIGYVYLDRWIKTWMPEAVDGLFRPALGFALTTVIMFIVFAPFLSILETLIVQLLNQIQKIPYGISETIFCIIWFPLVITGLHIPLMLVVMQAVTSGDPQSINWLISMLSIIGSGITIAILIKTRNLSLKTTALAIFVPGLIGIIEPFLYGLFFTKKKIYLTTTFSAAVVGFLCGITKVKSHTIGGGGFMSIIQVISGKNVTEITMASIILAVAFILPLVLGFIFINEFQSRKVETKKTNHQLTKFMKKNNFDQAFIKKQTDLMKLIGELFKDKAFGAYDKYIKYKMTLEFKKDKKIASQDKQLIKIANKIKKLASKSKDYENLIQKYEAIKLRNDADLIALRIQKLDFDSKPLENKIKSIYQK
ncbi:PTS system beta-glucoside-specific IIABC component [Spiroplasma clarkii]|nr:PTS transporter subunit EIIC [Spiroplasma clarkii]ARU91754.1 PTS system beta-glucoside-specific IIABC component [Spiroplasma clarkii]